MNNTQDVKKYGEPILDCVTTKITTENGLRKVNMDSAMSYVYPNDVTNSCVCKSVYENVGNNWYCRDDSK